MDAFDGIIEAPAHIDARLLGERQRPPAVVPGPHIRFVARDTARLDAELARTELGRALVTTVEQTVLDLARRPDLGDAAIEVTPAIRTLYRRCDREHLAELAAEQRMQATLDRVTELAGDG